MGTETEKDPDEALNKLRQRALGILCRALCVTSTICFSLVMLILIIGLVVYLVFFPPSLADDVKVRKVVDWPQLPANFCDKLLRETSTQGEPKFYKHIGTVTLLPVSFWTLYNVHPYSPQDLKTAFAMSDRAGRTIEVPYQITEICLNGTDSRVCQSYPYDLTLFRKSGFPFDAKRRTIIIIGGYLSDIKHRWQLDFERLWLAIDDVNVIRVSWARGNNMYYDYAAANTKILARQVTVLLYYLAQSQGISVHDDDQFLDNIYIIGHSLGAHTAGFIGLDFNGRIGRITGLDAAGPDFKTLEKDYRLDRTDAKLVELIHTNGGSFRAESGRMGMRYDCGHIDLYANNGKRQPTCSFLQDLFGCSHGLATDYYYLLLKHSYDMARIYSFSNDSRQHQASSRYMAFRAADFSEFETGTALTERCPIASMTATDLTAPDLPYCTIPIDFTSRPDDYRRELLQNHNVSFDVIYNKTDGAEDGDGLGNRYYIMTAMFEQPGQFDHYLMRIIIRYDNATEAAALRCTFAVHYEMPDGSSFEREAKTYRLSGIAENRYAIVIPFIASNSDNKYGLIKSEHRHHTGRTDLTEDLKQRLLNLMPTKIVVSKGAIEALESLVPVEWYNALFEHHKFNLQAESVSVRVMKMLHRHLVAHYSIEQPGGGPEVVDGARDPHQAPKLQPDGKPFGLYHTTSFYLNKLIVGSPLD